MKSKIKNVNVFRAGVWKPRSQPGSFHGIGEKALEWLKNVKAATGLKVTIEVANAGQVEQALEAGIDILWLGARTTVNPFYVQEIAEALKGVQIPVLIKNPVTPDLPLWIGAFERFMKSGNPHLGAIHRGFSPYLLQHHTAMHLNGISLSAILGLNITKYLNHYFCYLSFINPQGW